MKLIDRIREVYSGREGLEDNIERLQHHYKRLLSRELVEDDLYPVALLGSLHETIIKCVNLGQSLKRKFEVKSKSHPDKTADSFALDVDQLKDLCKDEGFCLLIKEVYKYYMPLLGVFNRNLELEEPFDEAWGSGSFERLRNQLVTNVLMYEIAYHRGFLNEDITEDSDA